MSERSHQEMIDAYLAIPSPTRGRKSNRFVRAGRIGGLARSPAKTRAARKNAALSAGATSAAKAAAARKNGRKGGRPRKQR